MKNKQYEISGNGARYTTDTLLANYELRLKDSGHALTVATRCLLEQKIAELKKKSEDWHDRSFQEVTA